MDVSTGDIVIVHPRAGLPLPEKLRTKLIYSQTFVTGGGAAGSVSGAQMVLNGAYNPYTSGGGHQPMGWDQLMVFYQFCRVYKTTATMIVSPGTGTAANVPHFGITFSENTSFSPSSFDQLVERGNCSYGFCPNANAFQGKSMVRRVWDSKKWWNKGWSEDQSNACTAAANPTGELAYANFWVVSPTGAAYNDLYYTCKLEFEVEFSGQLQVNQS